jgi:hypothetical protein
MSYPSINPWPNNANAPRITHSEYLAEKVYFFGALIGAVGYGESVSVSVYPHSLFRLDLVTGIVIVLFLQCMGALLSPPNRIRGDVRRSLAVHAIAMLLLTTAATATYLSFHSAAYIDNRGFPGVVGEGLPPGPFTYQGLIYSEPKSLIIRVVFVLNTWLADGLLVRSASHPATWRSNVRHFPSSTVAISSSPRTPGPLFALA